MRCRVHEVISISVVAYPDKSLLDNHSIFNSLDAMPFQSLK